MLVAVWDTPARLLRLLSLLQVRRDWTGPELAARLEVDVRTVRRDIERLRTLGYPVHSAPGVTGGYRLEAGGGLPPPPPGQRRAGAAGAVAGPRRCPVGRHGAPHRTASRCRRRAAGGARRRLPRPRDAALRLPHQRGLVRPAHGRAVPPRPHRSPLVPRRLGP